MEHGIVPNSSFPASATNRFSKLPYLGMKLGHWQKFQKWHVYCLSIRGSKLSLLALYCQRFLRYRPIFKIAILGMKLKFQKFHIYSWNYPPSPTFHSVFALRLASSKILAIFHFPIGHNVKFQSFLKNLEFEISRSKFCVDCYREH